MPTFDPRKLAAKLAREEAKKNGEACYKGMICSRCGFDEKSTHDGKCTSPACINHRRIYGASHAQTPKQIARRRAYYWRNREKIIAKTVEWGRKNRDKRSAASKRFAEKHREAIRAYKHEYDQREYVKQKHRENASRRYYADPALHCEKSRFYRLTNREKIRERKKGYESARKRKITDLLAVLREEMPELLKEFGL